MLASNPFHIVFSNTVLRILLNSARWMEFNSSYLQYLVVLQEKRHKMTYTTWPKACGCLKKIKR